MAVDGTLFKFVLHWTGHGEEGAVAAWYLGGSTQHSETLLGNALGNIDTIWGSDLSPTSWSQLQRFLDPAQSFDDMALYQYPVDNGPAVGIAHHAPTTARPGVGTALQALQVSTVATLHTELSGRRRTGRMFLPGHTATPGVDTQMDSDQCLLRATTVANAFATIRDSLASTFDAADALPWVVYSRAGRMTTDVTAVRVDSRLDIQRRRAAQQQSARASVVNVPANP